MDQPFEAGEGRPSQSQASPSPPSPAVGAGFYFAGPSLRDGAAGIYDGVQRVEVSRGLITEIVQRELMKQRIREEIIAREMPEMRLLEEEVRRELQVERALALGRFGLGAFSSVGGVAALPERRAPAAPELGVGSGEERTPAGMWPVGERLDNVSVFPESVLNGWSVRNLAPLQSNHENEGLASASAAPVGLQSRLADPLYWVDLEIDRINFVSTSEVDVVGNKRKLDDLPDPAAANGKGGAPPGSAEAGWSCALCSVSVCSREALQVHLGGKWHKKQARLLITKEQGSSTSTTRTQKPKKARATNTAGENVVTEEAGDCRAMQQKTGTRLWCELCGVVCWNDKTLAAHIGGKKHMARMRAAQCKNPAAAAVSEKTLVAVDVGQNNEVEEEEQKAASDEGGADGTGVVERPVPEMEEKEPAEAEEATSQVA